MVAKAVFKPEVLEYEKILRTQKSPKGHPLSESSIKNYMQKINHLLSEGYAEFFNEPEILIKRLGDKYPDNKGGVISRKAALMAIIKYLKTMGLSSKEILSELSEEYMSMSKEYVEQRDKNLKSQREQDNWMNYEDVVKLKKKIRCDPQFLALFKIYTEFPPMRNDVYNLKYKNYNKDKDNFFDVKDKKIVINEYKESKVYGPITLELGKTLFNNLKKLSRESQDDFVFHNLHGAPFTDTKNFSTYFKRKFKNLTGKVIGTTMLRKIFMAHFSKSNPTVEERKKVAHIMGHSHVTGLEYDRRDKKEKN